MFNINGGDFMDVDRCVMCGEPVPEGLQVCPECANVIVMQIGLDLASGDDYTGVSEGYLGKC